MFFQQRKIAGSGATLWILETIDFVDKILSLRKLFAPMGAI